MLKKIEECEIPVIKILLETLKEVSDFSAKLRAVFADSGDFNVLDTDQVHALLSNYGIPGETMMYCRDGLIFSYCDFLAGTITADELIEEIEEVIAHLQRLYKEHGEEIYEPFDMEQYLARYPMGGPLTPVKGESAA
ncbi:hypothetical protein NSS79_34135 [Paenibacillus sp. FSL L8-0436]|uniref:hypothetical protein n=1 Tax=Paenibacillus sp. FSL L8-0436 TaxID=2954686 RepID=UPI003158045D